MQSTINVTFNPFSKNQVALLKQIPSENNKYIIPRRTTSFSCSSSFSPPPPRPPACQVQRLKNDKYSLNEVTGSLFRESLLPSTGKVWKRRGGGTEKERKWQTEGSKIFLYRRLVGVKSLWHKGRSFAAPPPPLEKTSANTERGAKGRETCGAGGQSSFQFPPQGSLSVTREEKGDGRGGRETAKGTHLSGSCGLSWRAPRCEDAAKKLSGSSR